ncbi:MULTISPECIES: DNA-directed RNA polymerase subunit omega [Thermoactinomyces]|uniref:DNA-directed RNA polymerase subunit omega n=2 Tax=Thermoactinomyces TaxID=2023 RepID=A0A8I1DDU6_THEIN|nr:MULTISPECIES: DNA-directed RNA polymerase subunit omega [Thermoactinomyces]KFZ40610.1 DNA-directed RNA polymerase subunit omega [Thermoactinomyces sp. Gus2-1]KYQ86991.1 DNA-directed RNA polymerase subunit omega [Thermoactinomyces sp. AS95]MBA4547516.1 DNA-directed RNA polymerase subunit omega [Thermoactinomyces intermedius]MBA4551633.1 DNA-directed RNA polymerase subunit omega [Thermoactinomyces vulgaris]MBA4596488.1 DNA-directed RNA polymerase subunit omega [Thermoactinomyces vulgaris]
MLYPSIDLLMQKADSKYSLVVLAAKRARSLLEGESTQLEPKSQKYVGMALEEIAADILVPTSRE